MAAYCTLSDLVKLLPEAILIQLTDDDGLGVVDSGVVTEAIETAGAEIDGWCQGCGYVVPFDPPVPALIKKCAEDLAIYNLYSRRVEVIPETRATRYKEARQLLRDIAASRGPRLETAQVPVATTGGVAVVVPDRRMDMEGY